MKHQPRFQVKSITGFRINPNGESMRKEVTTYWVADTANCHREVKLIRIHRNGRGHIHGIPTGFRTTYKKEVAFNELYDTAELS